MQSATRVGILVVVFAALLFGFYAILGRSLLSKPVDKYYAEFSDANGVVVGAKVLMAGVKVGSVTEVKLVNARRARLTLELVKDTAVLEGSTITIQPALIGIGDNPLQIIPPADGSEHILAVGHTLTGKIGSPLDAILPESKQTLAEVNKTLVAFRQLLEDSKLKNGLTDVMATANKTMASFGTLAARIDGTVAQNQAEINRTISEVRRVVEDVHRSSAAIAQMINEGKIKKDTYALLDQMRAISANADRLLVNINQLVNDPKLREPANQAAANIQKMTESGTRIAADSEKIVRDGTVISKNAITLSEQAKEIAQHAIEIEQQLKGVLDKVGGFFNKPSGVSLLGGSTTGIDLVRETNPGHWRTDFVLDYPLSDGQLHFGVWDAFESNKLTLQLGKPVTPSLDYRYGIYASKPAVGVDYRIAPRVTLRGDLWDINSLRFDMKARYEIGNGLIGWLGYDRLFSNGGPSLGFGVRR